MRLLAPSWYYLWYFWYFFAGEYWRTYRWRWYITVLLSIPPRPPLISNKQVVVGVIILLLVVYTFYRLLHVWLHTLNFSEVMKHCWCTVSQILQINQQHSEYLACNFGKNGVVQARIQSVQGSCQWSGHCTQRYLWHFATLLLRSGAFCAYQASIQGPQGWDLLIHWILDRWSPKSKLFCLGSFCICWYSFILESL